MITVKGVRIESISISRDDKEDKVTGSYSIISNMDKVIAKQGFNSYSDIKIDWSSDTKKALVAFIEAVKEDIENTMGLAEKEA